MRIPVLILLILMGCLQAAAYDLKDNVILHAHKGETLMARQRYGEAIEEFKSALQLNPQTLLSASLYNNLGLAYLRTGQYPLAVTSFQRAIRLQPGFELYYKNLLQAYREGENLDEAARAVQRILQLNPKAAELWYLQGLLYEGRGESEMAQDAFSQYVKLAPHSKLAPVAKQRL